MTGKNILALFSLFSLFAGVVASSTGGDLRGLRRGGGGGGGRDWRGRSGKSGSIDFQNATCTAASQPVEPACTVGRRDEIGVWVCRTLYNIITGEPDVFTACIDTEKSIGTGDVCGCCGGTCPVACTCACDIPTRKFMPAREGVLIVRPNAGADDEGRCVDEDSAFRMISGPGLYGGRYVCDESCR